MAWFDGEGSIVTALYGSVPPPIPAGYNFDYGNGSPDPAVGVDSFSARWRGRLLARGAGSYTLKFFADDGGRPGRLLEEAAGGPGWRLVFSVDENTLFAHGVGLQLANPNALVYFGGLLPTYFNPDHDMIPQVLISMATVTVCEMFGLMD